MKTPRTSAADATTYLGRRSQPIRQIRINPPHNAAPDRAAGGRNGVAPANQPIEIFPGITHFTDAITALPKDLVRHFTLLREVDAKIYHPENALFRIVEELGNAPAPNCHSSQVGFPSAVSAATAASSSFSSSAGVPNPALATTLENSTGAQLLPNVHSRTNDLVRSADNFPRRVIACQAITKIQDMLVSLEEKNHVISVANDRLQQQLGRMEETWPHLLKEFSDEAKWGSTTHWAYPENRLNRHAVAQGNRGRDSTHHITSAAQALAEEAAARSDTRKQAVAAKKRNAHHQESDLDDHRTDHSKKSHGKSRKSGEAPGNYGLGVTTPSSTANGSHPSKRRKVDKAIANGATTTAERNMASVLGSNAHKGKTNSPRETPAPEPGPPRKRKPLPTSSSNGQNKKKKNGGVSGSAPSPSVTSSPGPTSLTEPKAATTASPAHPSAPKCTGTRAKQGSVPATSEKSRPSPAASAKPDSSTPKPPSLDAAPTSSGSSKAKEDTSTSKETRLESKEAASKPEPAENPGQAAAPSKSSSHKKESSKPEESNAKATEAAAAGAGPLSTTATTTKSGRPSKPSTPAFSTFAEAAPAKSRPSRHMEAVSSKRSHKKGAAALVAVAQLAEDDATSSAQGEEEDVNMEDDEPTYCYCNGVSYGEMVACDADGCEREWFHLECVGLKVAPKTNAKWYCEDCKEKTKNSGKKVNGR